MANCDPDSESKDNTTAIKDADCCGLLANLSVVDSIPDCAVCLQPCLHPVELPCGHIFCFLCVKGVAFRSRRCALCRQDVPLDYFEQPTVVKVHDEETTTANTDDTCSASGATKEAWFSWYYEGHNGWWQYDERATGILEEAFSDGQRSCELMIAGFIYVVDFEDMLQFRKNNLSRKRRIKRDTVDADKKGVAGLKIAMKHAALSDRSTDVSEPLQPEGLADKSNEGDN